MDDPKFSEILKEWKAPGAPASLDARVLGQQRPWWKVVFTGSVRVPVPVALAIAAALAVMAIALIHKPPPAPVASGPMNLADFRPLNDLNVRVIRGNHE